MSNQQSVIMDELSKLAALMKASEEIAAPFDAMMELIEGQKAMALASISSEIHKIKASITPGQLAWRTQKVPGLTAVVTVRHPSDEHGYKSDGSFVTFRAVKAQNPYIRNSHFSSYHGPDGDEYECKVSRTAMPSNIVQPVGDGA